MNALRHFARDQSSSTAIEYGLLAAMLAVALIGWDLAIRAAVVWAYNDFQTSINAGGPSVDGI
jgi:Flp pilus assembly pilin Flp